MIYNKTCSFLTIIVGLFCLFKACNAIQCYQCDSVLNETCATGVNEELETVECDRFDEKCAMTIIDGDTYRGCSKIIQKGPKYYTTCDTSNCNGGVYPPGRLKCYQCSGPTCVSAPEGKPKACRQHVEVDSCYTDIISEEDGRRGCISNEDQLSSNAVKCDLNGCNNEAGYTDLVCASCDSNLDKGCVRKLLDLTKPNCNIELDKNCTVRSLFGRPTESCFVYQNLSHVIRGCTNSGKVFNSSNVELEECKSNFCNRYCIEEVMCYQCNSTENESCRSDPEQLKPKLCVSSEDISCFSCEYLDGNIGRGCGIPDNIEMCSLCLNSTGCNNETIFKCYDCDSKENEDCMHWLTPDNINRSVCLTTDDQCGIVTKADGYTQRGCKSSLDNLCTDAYDCNFCSGNLCNDNVYSNPDTLWCYHCNLNSSEECANVTSNQNLPCVKHAEDNRCFQFLNNDNKMIRGCSSDTLYQECLEYRSNCIECDSNGCNNAPLKRNATFSCHVCPETEPKCAFQLEDDSTTLQECKLLVHFDEQESCYTLKINETSVMRGCTLDDQEILAFNRASLEICATNECNKNSVFQQKCIKCEGSNYTCKYEVSEEYSSECNTKNITYDLRGCFVKKAGEIISRGCVADLSSEDVEECNKMNAEICLICDGLDCNTKNLTGGSTLLKVSSFCILFVIFQHILFD